MFVNFGNILNALQSGARAGAAMSTAIPVSTGAINILSHNIGDVATSQRNNVIIQGASQEFVWGSHLWATNKYTVTD